MGRVALFRGPGIPFEIGNYPVPAPRGREVLVRVLRSAVCGSDLHTYTGRRQEPVPTVLGHESVASIVAFGESAVRIDAANRPLVVGQRITWSSAASCGTCFYCGNGLPQKCEKLFKYGHSQSVEGDRFAGGLADYVLLKPGTALFALPDAIPDSVAALANCSTATAAAVLRTGGPARTVFIFGAGALGLTACTMAKAAGAEIVAVCDRDSAGRDRAKAFGATHVFDGELADHQAELMAITQGRGFDLVLELAGSSQTAAACLPLARIGGAVIFAGTVAKAAAISVDPEMVVRRMLRIQGLHNYAPADLAKAIEFLAGAGRDLPFEMLIGHSFELQDVEAAFQSAIANPGRRSMIVPQNQI